MDGLGQLSVYVVENNLMYQNPVWTSPGHVENKWIRVQLALNPTKYKVSQNNGISALIWVRSRSKRVVVKSYGLNKHVSV